MANTTTLLQLRTRALDYADMTGSGFPVTAHVTDYVNDALAELHDVLVNTYDDYFLKTDSITIVAGTETYALPTDFYKARKLWFLSGNRRFPIPSFSLDEVSGCRTSPLSGGSAELWYVPQMTKLSADGDVVDSVLPYGWEDFAALHAAHRLLIREESVEHAQLIGAEKAKILQRIVALAEPRDTGDPEGIADYYGRWSDPRASLHADERHYRYRILGDNVHLIEVEYAGI